VARGSQDVWSRTDPSRVAAWQGSEVVHRVGGDGVCRREHPGTGSADASRRGSVLEVSVEVAAPRWNPARPRPTARLSAHRRARG